MRAPRYKCDAASPSIIWRLEHAAKAHVGGEEKLRSEGGCAPLRGDLLEAFDNIVADLDLRSAADRERAAKIVMRLALGQATLDEAKIRDEAVRLMRREGVGPQEPVTARRPPEGGLAKVSLSCGYTIPHSSNRSRTTSA